MGSVRKPRDRGRALLLCAGYRLLRSRLSAEKTTLAQTIIWLIVVANDVPKTIFACYIICYGKTTTTPG
jgi:hypothetical protein